MDAHEAENNVLGAGATAGAQQPAESGGVAEGQRGDVEVQLVGMLRKAGGGGVIEERGGCNIQFPGQLEEDSVVDDDAASAQEIFCSHWPLPGCCWTGTHAGLAPDMAVDEYGQLGPDVPRLGEATLAL